MERLPYARTRTPDVSSACRAAGPHKHGGDPDDPDEQDTPNPEDEIPDQAPVEIPGIVFPADDIPRAFIRSGHLETSALAW